jgi:hypothetical protein
VTKVRELLEAIERVRERIERHGSKLSQNEMLTRYALVDPILRALGWDTEDPEQVEPEPRTETGRPDYALKHDGKPIVMVEAKPLRSDLEKARGEGFRYCWQNKVPFYAITDGNVWELHDLREMGGKEIFRIQLKSDNPGDAARQLLALWRPAMPKVKVGPPSVTTEERETETRDETQLEQSLQWLKEQVRPGQSPPTSIRFPDGKQEDLRTWKDLLIAVAKWALPKLQQQRKLPLGSLIRRDGQMRAPRDIGDGWKVETWFGARGCVRNAVRILREAEISADEVFVTPGEGQGRRGRPPKRQR